MQEEEEEGCSDSYSVPGRANLRFRSSLSQTETAAEGGDFSILCRILIELFLNCWLCEFE